VNRYTACSSSCREGSRPAPDGGNGRAADAGLFGDGRMYGPFKSGTPIGTHGDDREFRQSWFHTRLVATISAQGLRALGQFGIGEPDPQRAFDYSARTRPNEVVHASLRS
jgi:hypothetical protein